MALSIGDAILKMGIDKTEFDSAMKSMDENIQSSMKKLQDGLRIGGVAFTALGVAGLKMVDTARILNSQLGQTGLTIGVSAKEMRDLALATTDVSFPLKSVTATFDLLARAGVKNTAEMKSSAKAFDALADAIGSSAEVVADSLIPVFRAFGMELPKTSGDLDKFTWLTKNTTVDLSDFAAVVQRLAPEMQTAGVSMENAMVALAGLEAQGITGRKATMALGDAITMAAKNGTTLTMELGLSYHAVNEFKASMNDAVGITEKYADVSATQFGIMDKVKQKFDEISLAAGSFLAPLEPLLGVMTALGPIMLFFSTSMGVATIKMIAHTAAVIAHGVALVATQIALGAVTAAQWLWNVAMTANPIGLIILGIMALIAAVVLLVKNWEKVGLFFKGLWAGIKDSFNTALQFIGQGINWLIQQLNKISFTVPDWVPLIGGKGFGINIPEVVMPSFQHGGIIPEPTLLYGLKSRRPYAIAGEAGPERVVPSGGGYQTANIIIQLDGRTLAQAIGQPLVDTIRVRTGVRI